MQSPVQLYMLFVLGCLILLKSFREILNNNYLKWLFFFLIYSWTIDIISKSISGDLHPLLEVSYNVSFFLFFVYLLTGIYLYLILVMLKKKYGEVFKTREYDLQMRSYIGIGSSNGVIIDQPREEEKHTVSFFLTEARMNEIDEAIRKHFEEK